MTGTSRIKPPRSDAEFARNTTRRLESVENPESMRAGEWVLSTSEDGSLIASNVNGGSVVLSGPPPPGEDPDRIVSDVLPELKVRRSTTQRVPGSTVGTVEWDAIDTMTGAWSVLATDTFTEVYVPRDGLYLVIYKLSWSDSSEDIRKAMIEINGVVTDAHEIRPGSNRAFIMSHYLVNTYPLTSSQPIKALAWTAGSSLLNAPFGFSENDPNSFTSLSVVCLR